LAQARQNFDYATPEFIDVAVAELAAAEARVDLLYRLAKEVKHADRHGRLPERSLPEVPEVYRGKTGIRKVHGAL